MSGHSGKTGRPKNAEPKVQLGVTVRATVKRAFMRHIGPGRVLSHAVEQALQNEMRRASRKECA